MHKPQATTTTSLPPKSIQQDGDVQEMLSKHWLSTLPQERGWVSSHMYQYQGFWYPALLLQATLACQQHFQSKDDDILLVTTPKSGTTWLKALIFTIANRTLHPIDQKHPLLTKNSHELVPFLESELYLDDPILDLSSFTSPRLFATHLPHAFLPQSIHTSMCKIVYLCRNPKDILISLWHFANKIRDPHRGSMSLEDAVDMFCRGVTLLGPLWDHVLSYWQPSLERPEKVLFLSYEAMKEEPILELKRIAAFLGCPFSIEEEKSGVVEEIVRLCSFDHLSNLEVNKKGKRPSTGCAHEAFFRKGAVGDWKNHLTPQMVDRIDSITKLKFEGTGLNI